MFGSGMKIGRWFGVDVSIDGSWVIIALLVGWSFFGLYQIEFPDLAGAATLVLATVTAALFFASVVLHEVSHAVMARRRGVPVEGITLFIFGGVTKTKQDAQRPQDEFAIAVVGPLTSVVIAAGFWVLVNLTGDLFPAPVRFGFGYLGWINLALGIFNLLPGFPLDGGRVLRAILWRASGNMAKATRRAANAGRFLAGGLIALGLFVLFSGNLGGLWYAAIGWFLLQAASASGAQVAVSQILRGVSAGDLMSPDPRTVPASASLREAVDEYFLRYDHSAFPVRGDSGDLIGILTLRAIRQVPSDQWEVRQAWAAMTRIHDAVTVPVSAPMDEVIEQLREPGHDRVLVLDDQELVGIITPGDIARWIRVSQELGLVEET